MSSSENVEHPVVIVLNCFSVAISSMRVLVCVYVNKRDITRTSYTLWNHTALKIMSTHAWAGVSSLNLKCDKWRALVKKDK